MGRSIPRICPFCGQEFTNMKVHWSEYHKEDVTRGEFVNAVGPSNRKGVYEKTCPICGERIKYLKKHWRTSHSDLDYWDYIWIYMGRPVCKVCGKELKGPQYGHHPHRPNPPRACCHAHENTLRYREGTLNSNTAFGGEAGRRKGIETSKRNGTVFGGPEAWKRNAGIGARAAAKKGVCFGGRDRTNAKIARAEAQSNPDYPVRLYIGLFLDLRDSKVYTKVGISHDIGQRLSTLWKLDYRPQMLIHTDWGRRADIRDIERTIHRDLNFAKFKMDSRRGPEGIGSNGPREWYLDSEFNKIKSFVEKKFNKEFSEWPLEK